MTELWEDPAWREFVDQIRTDLVPKLEDSGAVVSIVPDGEGDVKFAVELGFSIMLDKPIIVVVPEGRLVPERLARVADRIVPGDMSSDTGRQQLMEALKVTMRELAHGPSND